MPSLSRIMTLMAAALLGLLFVMPLWVIRLHAPQYPEGLGMLIRINTITGVNEHDLTNINTLNHYIGMRAIEPQSIPELSFMPWIVGALILTGLIVAAIGRRALLIAWLAGFALAGIAGLYDFWRWGYDYGHNIDAEHAIISIPGMTYQPPLIGTKQLLNITAASWPATGAIVAGIAFALAAAALVLAYRSSLRGTLRRPSATMALVVAAGCSVGPVPIAFGMDLCDECRMVISDRRFGAEIVTRTGKALKFDSVDCMLTHLAKVKTEDVASLHVVDASNPGELVAAESAAYVTVGVVRPPMGEVVAAGSIDAVREFLPPGGDIMTWSELRQSRDSGVAHVR